MWYIDGMTLEAIWGSLRISPFVKSAYANPVVAPVMRRARNLLLRRPAKIILKPRSSPRKGLTRKEIFILCPQPPELLGGMEACIREQVRGFQKRGYNVRVFHRENSGSNFSRRFVGKMSRHISDALHGFLIGREAHKAMHKGVAAVFSHSVVGWYPLRLPPGCKLYHLYHGTFRGQAEAIRPFITYLGYLKLKWWDSMMLERMSGRGKQIFTVSELIGIEVKKYFGYDSTTLGNPLDMSHFRPLDRRQCRQKFGLPQDGVVGVFVGTTQPNKNFPVVRRLMESLPDVYWVLALRGGWPSKSGLAKTVQVLEDVPAETIPEIYSAADFSICPSRYDPFPYVVPEALACGLPVLSGMNGGSHQFLLHPPLDRLVVSDPDNLDGFVAAAKGLVSHTDYYRNAVLLDAKPAVEQWMNLDNWWRRFWDLTRL
jgi:glycosyltransferase involved in cell wall biosynthesis